jgi:hypothetical protein
MQNRLLEAPGLLLLNRTQIQWELEMGLAVPKMKHPTLLLGAEYDDGGERNGSRNNHGVLQ